MFSARAGYRCDVVLKTTCHSCAVSMLPCHQYVLVIGPTTCPQAASRAATAARDSASAASRESVVVTTWQYPYSIKRISAQASLVISTVTPSCELGEPW